LKDSYMFGICFMNFYTNLNLYPGCIASYITILGLYDIRYPLYLCVIYSLHPEVWKATCDWQKEIHEKENDNCHISLLSLIILFAYLESSRFFFFFRLNLSPFFSCNFFFLCFSTQLRIRSCKVCKYQEYLEVDD